jgi:hypothetical protein
LKVKLTKGIPEQLPIMEGGSLLFYLVFKDFAQNAFVTMPRTHVSQEKQMARQHC